LQVKKLHLETLLLTRVGRIADVLVETKNGLLYFAIHGERILEKVY
jgi:hypothetical protein